MRIRMTRNISGTRDGASWPQPGESLDVPPTEADALIAAGVAVAEEGVQRAASRSPGKKAVRPDSGS